MVNNKDLIDFLKSKTVHSGLIDQLKVSFRPLICPFNDLLNLVGNASDVFDIGCGSGQFALLLAEFTSVKRIGGIEVDSKLIGNSRMLLQPYNQRIQIDFQVYNGTEFPNHLRDYNLIFLIDVLHHIPPTKQRAFLEGIFQKMKDGATLVIKDIDRGSPLVFFNKVHDLIFSHEIGHELSLKKITEDAKEIGFNISDLIKKRIYVYPHYTIILKK